VVVASVVLAARQVLLPFILALVVAYVLLPSVKRVERLRVPRWAAILLVYAVTLGTVGFFVSAIVPRLITEGRGLAAEWPELTATARRDWLPSVDRKLAAWSGQPVTMGDPQRVPQTPPVTMGDPQRVPQTPPVTMGDPQRGPQTPPVTMGDPQRVPQTPPAVASSARVAEAEEKPPTVRVVVQPDGSYDVRVADGVVFRERREGIWSIEQVEKTRVFSSAQALRDGFDKGLAYLQENSIELINIGRKVVFAIGSGIFTLFMTLMLAAYLMLTHERIFAFFRGLAVPASRPSFDRFVARLDRGLAGVVRGQLMICLVNGVLSAIGFSLFGLKYWPILAVVAAVMSLIPIFGSILSSVPAVAIGLTQSPATAVGVLAWILGIHQLEANFLNPKIIGDAAKIHPVLVVFSLIVGEHFFQLVGALFAVPAMSVAQTLFLHFRETTMGAAAAIGDGAATPVPVSVPPVVAPVALAALDHDGGRPPMPPLRADPAPVGERGMDPRSS
jgi:predicted PurR-regulated permease PerM